MLAKNLIVGAVMTLGASGCLVRASEAMTYSEWTTADKSFQKGYVFGIAESLMNLTDSENQKSLERTIGYNRCFGENKMTSETTFHVVISYLFRTPDAATTPMTANILRALSEACKSYVPE